MQRERPPGAGLRVETIRRKFRVSVRFSLPASAYRLSLNGPRHARPDLPIVRRCRPVRFRNRRGHGPAPGLPVPRGFAPGRRQSYRQRPGGLGATAFVSSGRHPAGRTGNDHTGLSALFQGCGAQGTADPGCRMADRQLLPHRRRDAHGAGIPVTQIRRPTAYHEGRGRAGCAARARACVADRAPFPLQRQRGTGDRRRRRCAVGRSVADRRIVGPAVFPASRPGAGIAGCRRGNREHPRHARQGRRGRRRRSEDGRRRRASGHRRAQPRAHGRQRFRSTDALPAARCHDRHDGDHRLAGEDAGRAWPRRAGGADRRAEPAVVGQRAHRCHHPVPARAGRYRLAGMVFRRVAGGPAAFRTQRFLGARFRQSGPLPQRDRGTGAAGETAGAGRGWSGTGHGGTGRAQCRHLFRRPGARAVRDHDRRQRAMAAAFQTRLSHAWLALDCRSDHSHHAGGHCDLVRHSRQCGPGRRSRHRAVPAGRHSRKRGRDRAVQHAGDVPQIAIAPGGLCLQAGRAGRRAHTGRGPRSHHVSGRGGRDDPQFGSALPVAHARLHRLRHFLRLGRQRPRGGRSGPRPAGLYPGGNRHAGRKICPYGPHPLLPVPPPSAVERARRRVDGLGAQARQAAGAEPAAARRYRHHLHAPRRRTAGRRCARDDAGQRYPPDPRCRHTACRSHDPSAQPAGLRSQIRSCDRGLRHHATARDAVADFRRGSLSVSAHLLSQSRS